MEEDLVKLKKSNNRKKAVIVILIFILVLAGILIFVLLCGKKNDAPKKDEPKQEEKKEEEPKEEEKEDEQPSTAKVTFNGKEYTIRTDSDLNGYPVTYLNEKRIDGIGANRAKAMNGYLLLIYDGGQFGSDFVFLDDDLSVLPIDVKYHYNASNSNDYGPIFDFSNNKVKAKFINSNFEPSSDADFSIENVYIYKNENNICEGKKNVSEYKEIIEKHKNDIISGTIEFSYNNHKMSYTYIEKQTVWDILSKAVENNKNDYCATED